MEQPSSASDSVTMTYFYIGGTHSPNTWQAEFAHALPHLYRASPPDRFRVPATEFMRTMLTAATAAEREESSNSDDNDGAEDYSSQLHALIGLAIACTLLLVINLCVLCITCMRYSNNKSPPLLQNQTKSDSAL
mmetsp:Transcript_24472/g.41439  ORF Transcript_24472/g.41439 Transcript_24472/m.41439 type:complete len:134 (-) Transcript_24472:230-631(-)